MVGAATAALCVVSSGMSPMLFSNVGRANGSGSGSGGSAGGRSAAIDSGKGGNGGNGGNGATIGGAAAGGLGSAARPPMTVEFVQAHR